MEINAQPVNEMVALSVWCILYMDTGFDALGDADLSPCLYLPYRFCLLPSLKIVDAAPVCWPSVDERDEPQNRWNCYRNAGGVMAGVSLRFAKTPVFLTDTYRRKGSVPRGPGGFLAGYTSCNHAHDLTSITTGAEFGRIDLLTASP